VKFVPLLFLAVLVDGPTAAPQMEAHAVVARTLDAVGFSSLTSPVLHYHYMEGAEQDFQSSAPFVTVLTAGECWFDPGEDGTGADQSNVGASDCLAGVHLSRATSCSWCSLA
jgi:hypothetical protein